MIAIFKGVLLYRKCQHSLTSIDQLKSSSVGKTKEIEGLETESAERRKRVNRDCNSNNATGEAEAKFYRVHLEQPIQDGSHT